MYILRIYTSNRVVLQVQTLRFEKMLDINGNLKIHRTFQINGGIQDGQKTEIGIKWDTHRRKPELGLYSCCIQSVLKLIVEANTFERQNRIQATLSTMGYTKW